MAAYTGKLVVGEYLNLTAAFVRLFQRRKMSTNKSYGISDSLSWFTPCVSSRNQEKSVNGYPSHPWSVTRGVVGISVLGSPSFLLLFHRYKELFYFSIGQWCQSPLQLSTRGSRFFHAGMPLDPMFLRTLNSKWLVKFSAEKCCVLWWKCSFSTTKLKIGKQTIPNGTDDWDLSLN